MADAVTASYAAIAEVEAAMALLSTPGGSPVPLTGPGGLLPPLALMEFQDFLTAAGVFSALALPPFEVAMIDSIMTSVGVTLLGEPSVGPAMATYIAQGDTGSEAALFGPGASLEMFEVLQTAVPTRWDRILMCESPVWIACGGPPCSVAVPTVSDAGRVWVVGLLIGISIALLVLGRRSTRA